MTEDVVVVRVVVCAEGRLLLADYFLPNTQENHCKLFNEIIIFALCCLEKPTFTSNNFLLETHI